MKAEEMRKITEQAKVDSANKFWEECKDNLFKGLKRMAECRRDSVVIGYADELGKTKQGCSWVKCKYLREKVKQELESLGYKFSYSDTQQGEFVTISW